MLSEKITIINIIVGLIKKISLYKKSFYPERYSYSKKTIKT